MNKESLPPVFCRKISSGRYYVKIEDHEYEIFNFGYYPPDKCIWWEAQNIKTKCADFHDHTKRSLIERMRHELSKRNLNDN